MSKPARIRNRSSRSSKARGRDRMVGLAGAAGMALTFGIGPLAAAPRASADEFDAIFDAIGASIAGLGDAGRKVHREVEARARARVGSTLGAGARSTRSTASRRMCSRTRVCWGFKVT